MPPAANSPRSRPRTCPEVGGQTRLEYSKILRSRISGAAPGGPGRSLVFLGGDTGDVNDETGALAKFADAVYFAGFRLFTLGLGIFWPEGAVWQVLSALCVASGFLTLTVSVAYLMPL